jgi:hypothetical protein
VDRPETSTVTGGHVLVKRVHGVRSGHLTVLLVHVVGSGARVVTDPDTEVLDLGGALLVDLGGRSVCRPAQLARFLKTYLVQRDDLTVRLLDLSQLTEEVPES